MKSTLASLTLLIAATSLPASANGILLPAVQITLGDGSVTPVPLTFRENPNIPGAIDFVGSLQLGGDDILIGGTTKFDPFIQWGFQLTDLDAPTSFMVTIGAPLLGGPYDTASATLNGVIPPGRLPIVASNVSLESGVGPDFNNITFIPGVGIFPASCDSNSCGIFSAGPVNGSFGGAAMLTAFKVTGAGDGAFYDFTGRFDLYNTGTIPEPGTWALMAAGLSALTLLRGRKR